MTETNDDNASTEPAILKGEDAIALWKEGRDAWNTYIETHPGVEIDFSNVDFSPHRFESEPLSFEGFRFGIGDVSFKGAVFNSGDVSFEFATFDGRLSFNGATFGNGIVSFADATFGDRGTTFSFVNLTSSSIFVLIFFTKIFPRAFETSDLIIQSFKKTNPPINTSSFAAIYVSHF